ncbi:MAG: hypothetical protein R3B84_05855 [Zavarzinella sp.]
MDGDPITVTLDPPGPPPPPPPPSMSFLVNTLEDTHDADLTDGVALDANGMTSLRAALEQSNETATGSIIQFDTQLGINGDAVIELVGSRLVIEAPTHIKGSSGFRIIVTLSNGLQSNLLRIDMVAGEQSIIEHINFEGGYTVFNGGAIYHDSGELILNDVILANNYTSGRGGGIFVSGNNTKLTLNGVAIISNIAEQGGGGIYSEVGFTATYSQIALNHSDGNGGGIHTDGATYLNNVEVNGNSSGANGGGIYHSSLFGPEALVINNSTIESNTASGDGGGIFQAGLGFSSISINNTYIILNHAYNGGGIYFQNTGHIQNSFIDNNVANNGGGICNEQADLSVSNTTFIGNWAYEYGGALYLLVGSSVFSECIFSNNLAGLSFGAGMYGADVALKNIGVGQFSWPYYLFENCYSIEGLDIVWDPR